MAHVIILSCYMQEYECTLELGPVYMISGTMDTQSYSEQDKITDIIAAEQVFI